MDFGSGNTRGGCKSCGAELHGLTHRRSLHAPKGNKKSKGG